MYTLDSARARLGRRLWKEWQGPKTLGFALTDSPLTISYMKCLELLGILRSLLERSEGVLTAELLSLSALPVPLLRQVSVPGS